MSVSYDVTSTLREQTKHHEPIVLVYESHGQDARYRDMGETCEAISAKYGLGGQRTHRVAVQKSRGVIA